MDVVCNKNNMHGGGGMDEAGEGLRRVGVGIVGP